ncbi:MAG: hypothetical protein ACI9WU_002488 [Myxococcota bacterium]
MDIRDWVWFADEGDVWNRTRKDGYRWFYNREAGICGQVTVQHWFRTRVNSLDRAVSIRLFDEQNNELVGMNDRIKIFVNGRYIGSCESGGKRADIPMGWHGAPGQIPAKYLKAHSNEIAVLLEESCGWGGLGKLAVELTTEAPMPPFARGVRGLNKHAAAPH